MEKAFSTISVMVGVFLVTAFLVIMWNPTTRKALFDYSAKSTLSEEDYEAITDPQAANKAYQKMGREAWENSKRNQPTWNPNQPTWNQNWKK
jgi:hypothetical protein